MCYFYYTEKIQFRHVSIFPKYRVIVVPTKNLAAARRESGIYFVVELLLSRVIIGNVASVAATCALAYGSE